MNIYVEGFSGKVQEEDLKALFEQYGTVSSVKIENDRDTGRSKGFGFVTMEDENEAQAAMEALNGYEFKGRCLKVNPARERESHRHRYHY